MSTRDSIPGPSDPQYIASVECATIWNSVGVTEYSVFILTQVSILLEEKPLYNTRALINREKTAINSKTTRKKEKKRMITCDSIP